MFFELLYGEQPPGKILICETSGKRWSTHACLRPADAVQYVLGHVDVFHRVGLVAEKPPAGRRGDESATAALTAVWLDIDVNGAPDGRGSVVKDAAPNLEAAIELHHSVLQPSFTVGSGYGVHGYLRLAEPWLLHDDEERRRAKRLVRGWHERIKREAVSRGMAKFDSVFDLARVLRPVGSLNGKAAGRPVPVELLDDGGPVYTIEQIAAEIVEADEPVSASTAGGDTGPGRSIAELLEEFPQLDRIIRRDGKAPGKGSDSEWDFYLCCEGVRCGRSDPELAMLIERNRTVNPDPNRKRGRPDYIARTVASVRAKVEADAADPAKRLTDRWGARGDPIVGGKLLGDVASGSAIVRLERKSGAILRLPKLGNLFESRTHTRIVSQVAKTRFPPLTNAEAVELAQAIIELCPGEDADPLEEARQWITDFVGDLGGIETVTLYGDAAEQWAGLVGREDAQRRLAAHPNPARRTVAMRDERGLLWLPADPLRAHTGERLSWGDLRARLQEIGWRRVEVDKWERGVDRAIARRVHTVFYVGRP
jgi:hypothetical protein